jgi:hypothetical protein
VSNFQYTDRWPTIGHGLDPAAVTALESRDRELEQYLYAPPRDWSPTLWADALTTPVDVTSGWTIAAARWERLRGRFCVASVVARRTGAAAPGILGIALPEQAAPAPALPGILQVPVGGTAIRMRYADPLPPSREFVALRAYDQRATCGHWLAVYAASSGSGNPQMQVGDFSSAQLDVLVTTFQWRAT